MEFHKMSDSPRYWRCGQKRIALGQRTLIMGILNITPDSFSDGGEYFDPKAAIERAHAIARQGADILDIGAMSSRPGSEEIAEEEELHRLLPILQNLGTHFPIPVSVDTYRSTVARAAVQHGASIINDITALQGDREMAQVVADSGAGLILMHMRGTPRTMQQNTEYEDVFEELRQFLRRRSEVACDEGIEMERIVVDPGIGFGKSVEGNLELIRRSGGFRGQTAGVLMGPSRKSFIGKLTGREVPQERLWGSAAAVALCVAAGADIVRVHDVEAMRDVCKIADAVMGRVPS